MDVEDTLQVNRIVDIFSPVHSYDKQIQNLLNILNSNDDWNGNKQDIIKSTLSIQFENRIHVQALELIRKATTEPIQNEKIFQNLIKANFLERLSEFICREKVNTAELSSSIAVNFAAHDVNILDSFLPLILSKLKELPKDENYGVLQLRILFLFASIGTVSESAFKKTQQYNCLPEIIAAFEIEDVLEVLNVVEILQIVGSTTYGINYLITHGIAKEVVDFVSKEDDNAGGLLRDKCLSWVLAITRNADTQVILLESIPILETLETYFEHGNPVNAIIVVGSIGTTAKGIAQLFENQKVLSTALSYIHQSVEMKICVLSAITEMFEKRLTTTDFEVNQLKELFNKVSEEVESDLVVFLLEQLKNPYLDLRVGAYAFLQGLVRYAFGIEKISSTPGFLDYLLIRDREIEYEGNAWKFVIFQKLVEHPKSKEILGSYQYLNCVEYLKRGVLWKKTDNRVEIEESHM